jgi:hypothetical protein
MRGAKTAGWEATRSGRAAPPIDWEANPLAVASKLEKNWFAGSTMKIRFNAQTIPTERHRTKSPREEGSPLAASVGPQESRLVIGRCGPLGSGDITSS